MFPGVDGFHWTLTHILFLTIFALVLSTVAVTAVAAALRTVRKIRRGHSDRIRWKADFEDLPGAERACRHAITGTAPGRVCPNALDCRVCDQHAHFAALEDPCDSGADLGLPYGLHYPARRYYDRGHTWVELSDDGLLTVGLDDLGLRLAGRFDRMELPRVGKRLSTRGRAWTIVSGGIKVKVRSPISGIVVATGGPADGWYLKVRPARQPADLRHLLRGPEVGAWLRHELERLQILLAPASTGPSLADGGTLEPDLPEAQPNADWHNVYSAMFLEP